MTSKEGNSLHTLFTKYSTLLFTSSTAFLVSTTLTMASCVVSKVVKPFKNTANDSFNNVSTLAFVVKNNSLTCDASSFSFIIVFNNSYFLALNFPCLITKVVVSYIVVLCASRDSITNVVQMHTLFSSTYLNSQFNW